VSSDSDKSQVDSPRLPPSSGNDQSISELTRHLHVPSSLFHLMNGESTNPLMVCQNLVTLPRIATVQQALEAFSKHQILSAPILDMANKCYTGTLDILALVTFVLSCVPGDVLEQASRSTTERRKITLQDRKPLTPDQVSRLLAAGRNCAQQQIGAFLDDSDHDTFPPLLEETSIAELILWFASGARRSPVVNGSGMLVGILSQTAVVSWLADKLDHPFVSATTSKSLAELGFAASFDVTTIHKSETVLSALRAIRDIGDGGLAVVDDDGRLFGNFSASDIRCIDLKDWSALLASIESFLTTHRPHALKPITLTPKDRMCGAVRLMSTQHVHKVWIVDEAQKPIGLVTTSDLLDVLRWHFECDEQATEDNGNAGKQWSSSIRRRTNSLCQLPQLPLSITQPYNNPNSHQNQNHSPHLSPDDDHDDAKMSHPVLTCSPTQFGIGDQFGYALSLDRSVKYGYASNASRCFGRTNITDSADGRFVVANVEVWSFIDF